MWAMANADAVAESGGHDALQPTFEAAYHAHRAMVYRLALRYGAGRTAWAEDVAHDVFVKLWQHLPALTDRSQLGGWLYRATARVAISRLRRERSLVTKLGRMLAGVEEPIAPALAERADAARALAMLHELPGRERVVLCMLVLDGKTQQEIAATLQLSKGYVSKLVERGWQRIRAAGWQVADEA
jgi:RNA polymerase sigma-70 factor (ECF subfamily)